MSNARYNPLKTAVKRGWSADDLSTTSLAGAPRHGFKWNDAEHRDLALAYLTTPVEERSETPFLFRLADAHGRAYSGITSRLQKLRLDESRVVLGVDAALEYDGWRDLTLRQGDRRIYGLGNAAVSDALEGKVFASDRLTGTRLTRALEVLKQTLSTKKGKEVLVALFPRTGTLAELLYLAAGKYLSISIEPDTGKLRVTRDIKAHPALAAPYGNPINYGSSTAAVYEASSFGPVGKHLAVLRGLTRLEEQRGAQVYTTQEVLVQVGDPAERLVLADLRRHGLIDKVDGHGTLPKTYGLTDAGRAAVVEASRKEGAARAEADAAAACPAEYHVVVRAGLTAGTALRSGRRHMKHPPTAVHPTREAAEAEAERLATENPGEAFHVLSTVAVAESEQVQRTAVRAVR